MSTSKEWLPTTLKKLQKSETKTTVAKYVKKKCSLASEEWLKIINESDTILTINKYSDILLKKQQDIIYNKLNVGKIWSSYKNDFIKKCLEPNIFKNWKSGDGTLELFECSVCFLPNWWGYFEYDHWLPKSVYPFLVFNIYNLHKTDKPCNWRKGNIDPEITYSKYENATFIFKIEEINLETYIIDLKLSSAKGTTEDAKTTEIKITKFLNTMKMDVLYTIFAKNYLRDFHKLYKDMVDKLEFRKKSYDVFDILFDIFSSNESNKILNMMLVQNKDFLRQKFTLNKSIHQS